MDDVTAPTPGIADVVAARQRIAGLVQTTPLWHSRGLSSQHSLEIHLKLENLQATGSFKVRGAASKLISLSARERARGVIACSSGNHGLATSYVARQLQVRATVCVPTWVDPSKLAAIRAQGARVVVKGDSYDAAEEESLRISEEEHLVHIHPFDDPAVIAGQGTIGLEIVEQLPDVDAVLVPLSGGGLLAGVAMAIKSVRPQTRVIGVAAAEVAVMVASLAAGHPVRIPEGHTIASALAGGIGAGNRYTLPMSQRWVDATTTVSEAQIAAAVRLLLLREHILAEGGGAVGVAALGGELGLAPGSRVAVVISGGNIAAGLLQELLAAAD